MLKKWLLWVKMYQKRMHTPYLMKTALFAAPFIFPTIGMFWFCQVEREIHLILWWLPVSWITGEASQHVLVPGLLYLQLKRPRVHPAGLLANRTSLRATAC